MLTQSPDTVEPVSTLAMTAPFLGFMAQWLPRYPSIADHVYLKLWQRIVSGQWAAGVSLLDVQLCEDLGASRTPIREALQRLVQEGLVEKVRRNGFRVVMPSAGYVTELYDARTALETMAVWLATPLMDPHVLHTLRTATTRLLADGANEPLEDFLAADVGLHLDIMNACANTRLQKSYVTLLAQVGLFQVSQAAYTHARMEALEDHMPIIDCLQAGDRDAASQAMFHHIQNTKDRVLRDVYKHPPAAG